MKRRTKRPYRGTVTTRGLKCRLCEGQNATLTQTAQGLMAAACPDCGASVTLFKTRQPDGKRVSYENMGEE